MLLWCTDLHLSHLNNPDGAMWFAEYLSKENPKAEGLIITGDISVATQIENHLEQLALGFRKPIYFILVIMITTIVPGNKQKKLYIQ
jgi:UDP-2,3-diacylglucosamine pyrophosphatase LpxH